MELKVMALVENARGFLYMAIDIASERTPIYLHAISKKTGEAQWYESNSDFARAYADTLLRGGQYSVVFTARVKGIKKSTVTDWV